MFNSKKNISPNDFNSKKNIGLKTDDFEKKIRSIPDFKITKGWCDIGIIEAKNIDKNLDDPDFQTQFEKYKQTYENVLITNFLEWRWYYKQNEVKRIKLGELVAKTDGSVGNRSSKNNSKNAYKNNEESVYFSDENECFYSQNNSNNFDFIAKKEEKNDDKNNDFNNKNNFGNNQESAYFSGGNGNVYVNSQEKNNNAKTINIDSKSYIFKPLKENFENFNNIITEFLSHKTEITNAETLSYRMGEQARMLRDEILKLFDKPNSSVIKSELKTIQENLKKLEMGIIDDNNKT